MSVLADGATAQGWQQVGSGAGVLNQPLPPITVPVDDRLHRLVIKEIENFELLDPPASGDVLTRELGRRVVFADVVTL